MDDTSALETLGSFWMALSWYSNHQVGAWAILYPLIKVSSQLLSMGIAHGIQQVALLTLSQLFSIAYRWITWVLKRPLKG